METKKEFVNNVALPKGDEANTMETVAKDKVKSPETKNQFWEILKRFDGLICILLSLAVAILLIWLTDIRVWVCKNIFLDPKLDQPCCHIFANRFSFPIVMCLLVCALISLFFYYVSKKTKGWEKCTKEYQTFKIGEDISNILSWFFSANGLLFIIAITIVSLIIFIMCNSAILTKGDGKGELQLMAITITISLSAIIPAVISKILARGEIVSIIEEKLKLELKEYDISLYNLRRDKAHASRMSAVFLFQLASQQKELALGKRKKSININNLQLALKNATWSVGWASVAVSQYILVKDQEPEADTLCKELMSEYFSKYEDFITDCLPPKVEKTLNTDKEIFRSRDFISLVIMHALINHFRYLKGNEETILKLEKLFVKENPDNKHIEIDCGVLGLGKESKEELTKLTKRIIWRLRNEDYGS